jgi:hypothetical protein
MSRFVIRGFGEELDTKSQKIDFEAVDKALIAPALRACQLQSNTTAEVLGAGGANFNVDDLAFRAVLAVLQAQPPALQCVPQVEDLKFLPDMGRMNTNWLSGGRTGCSPAACGPAGAPRPC